jgi:hypothetical protein
MAGKQVLKIKDHARVLTDLVKRHIRFGLVRGILLWPGRLATNVIKYKRDGRALSRL